MAQIHAAIFGENAVDISKKVKSNKNLLLMELHLERNGIRNFDLNQILKNEIRLKIESTFVLLARHLIGASVFFVVFRLSPSIL